MHIVALVDSPQHVCCRYRVAAFQPAFHQAGHTLELRSLPSSLWQRLRLAHSLRRVDVVILQRKLLPGWQLSYLRRQVARLIFDMDDAIFLRDSYSPRGLHDPRRWRRFSQVVRLADTVVAGNDYLAGKSQQIAPLTAAPVIPTCVDPARYPVADHLSRRESVQLVWIGSSSTLQGLESIHGILESIGLHCPNVRLKLICDRFLQLHYLPVQACPWAEATEAAELASADIGIAWVPDDDWSRGKCGLKVLQYMAAGLPVVANPVGVHVEMVRDGETGFLVRTSSEWKTAIQRLAASPALRQRMGQAGRRLLEEKFSVDAGAKLWLDLLARLTGSRSEAPSQPSLACAG